MLAFLSDDPWLTGTIATFATVPLLLALLTPRRARPRALLAGGAVALIVICAYGSVINWDAGGDTGRGWTAVATVSLTYVFVYGPLWGVASVVGAFVALGVDKARTRLRPHDSPVAPHK